MMTNVCDAFLERLTLGDLIIANSTIGLVVDINSQFRQIDVMGVSIVKFQLYVVNGIVFAWPINKGSVVLHVQDAIVLQLCRFNDCL